MKGKIDERLGTREVFGIVMVILVLKATDTTPVPFFEAGYSAGWIIPIISALFVAVPLLCTISFLKAYRDKGFIEVVFHLYGKYFGTVIGLVLFYIIFDALTINTRSYVDIMSSNFYPRTPKNIIYAITIIASCYVAWLGIHAIGRTAWIFTPVLQFVMFILVFFARKRVNMFFIFPLAGSGVVKLIKSGFVNSTMWGDIFYLSVIFPLVKNYKSFKKANLLGYAVSVVEFVTLMIVYVITFGYPTVAYLDYPLQELTKYSSFGSYFTHNEAVFLGFWIIAAVLRFAAQLYFAAVTLSHVLKIKNHKPLLFPLSASAMAFGMLPENSLIVTFIMREELFKWSWPLLLALPVSMWMIGRIRREL